jgi:hypothetical protein
MANFVEALPPYSSATERNPRTKYGRSLYPAGSPTILQMIPSCFVKFEDGDDEARIDWQTGHAGR